MVPESTEEIMPTYDYKCPKCDKVQERFHGMNEIPTVICEQCPAVMIRMVGAGSGIIFKGDGWTPKHFK